MRLARAPYYTLLWTICCPSVLFKLPSYGFSYWLFLRNFVVATVFFCAIMLFFRIKLVLKSGLLLSQTNTSVANSLGTHFLSQISLIFLDMLNVYRYCPIHLYL